MTVSNKPMIYGSVCSGIEAATVAWEPIGWMPSFFSEIEKFPREVLNHHYPAVPCHGDFTTIEKGEYEPIELLVGGTPCQSFSVAGLRKGLDDERGNLALEYLRLAQRLGPKWLVWENVPGVLSSNEGRDFGSFLGALGELGYGFSYRVLDAQYFGVAQRRRRVFVVAHLGDWRPAAAVLFERYSLSGDSAPSREAQEMPAYTLDAGSARRRGSGMNPNQLVAYDMLSFGQYGSGATSSTLKQRDYKDATDLVVQAGLSETSHTLTKCYDSSEDGTGRGTPLCVHGTQDPITSDIAFPVGRNNGAESAIAVRTAQTSSNGWGVNEQTAYTLDQTQGQAVCFTQNSRSEVREMTYAGALAANHGVQQQNYVKQSHRVRRLTPIECERLQGFPDNYTRIPWRGKAADDCPDGPRYKAIGNSMAVPVMRWIGDRIQLQQELASNKEVG